MASDNANSQMSQLLGDMMKTQTEDVHQFTEQLNSLYANPDSTVEVCSLIGNVSKLPAMRKCACYILKTRVGQPAVWQNLGLNQQRESEEALLSALKSLTIKDDENLQMSIVRCVGLAMERSNEAEEEQRGDFNDRVLDYVQGMCVGPENGDQLFGAVLFKQLAKTSPNVLDHYLVRTKDIFFKALALAKQQDQLTAPPVENLLIGWNMIIPFSCSQAEQAGAIEITLPLIAEATRAFGYQPNPKNSDRGFKLIMKVNKYLPKLVRPHLKLLVNDLCALADDAELNDEVRMQTLGTIKALVLSHRRQITRIKMLDKVLLTMFNVMAFNPEAVLETEEIYVKDIMDWETSFAEAAQTLLIIASQSNTNRVAMRTLRLLRPHLVQRECPVRRVASQLFLAMMAKGFRELLASKPLSSFVLAIERGVRDDVIVVRRAAYFALAVVAENLQPEITVLAPQVLQIFDYYFDEMTPEQRLGSDEADSQIRLFCTLEIYCESLKRDVLQEHLADIMQRLLNTVQPVTNSVPLRQLAFNVIASLAKASQTMFRPYFDTILDIVMPLVKDPPEEDYVLLRMQGLHVLSALEFVDQEKFMALIPDLVEIVVQILQNEFDMQVYIFDLVACLSAYVPQQLVDNFEPLMAVLLATIREATELPREIFDNADTNDEDGDDDDEKNAGQLEAESNAQASGCTEDASVGDAPGEATGEGHGHSDGNGNGNGHGGHGDQTDMRSVSSIDSTIPPMAPDKALICLRALIINMPDAVTPYLAEVRRCATACTDTPNEIGRRAAYEVLTQLAVLDHRNGNKEEAKRQWCRLMPELVHFVERAKETEHVFAIMSCIGVFLRLLKLEALNRNGFTDRIIGLIRRTLGRKLTCQFKVVQDENIKELKEWSHAIQVEMLVMEAAGDVLHSIGYTMGTRQYARQFSKISNSFVRSLRHCKPSGKISDQLFFLYRMVFRCMGPLGVIAEQYYDLICYSIIDCMMSPNPHMHSFAIEEFYWLFGHVYDKKTAETVSKIISKVFLSSLNARSHLIPETRERVSGVIAHMILISESVVSERMVTSLCASFPFNEDLNAYDQVVRALRWIYENKRNLLEPLLNKVLNALLDSVEKYQLSEDRHSATIEFLERIRNDHPALYNEVSLQYPRVSLYFAVD